MIANFMARFLERFNGCKFWDCLKLGNKELSDVPLLPNYADGERNMICFPHLLHQCHHKGCRYAHPPKEDIPDWYCKQLFTVISPGMDYAMRNGLGQSGSPRKRKGAQGS